MGLIEVPLIVAGWILTAGLAGVGGTFIIQGRNDKRVDSLKLSSDSKIEKLIDENDKRINVIIAANSLQNENVLGHIKNVEKSLNDMRAELPEKYTLKSDHLRLMDKIEDLSKQFYKHMESDSE